MGFFVNSMLKWKLWCLTRNFYSIEKFGKTKRNNFCCKHDKLQVILKIPRPRLNNHGIVPTLYEDSLEDWSCGVFIESLLLVMMFISLVSLSVVFIKVGNSIVNFFEALSSRQKGYLCGKKFGRDVKVYQLEEPFLR